MTANMVMIYLFISTMEVLLYFTFVVMIIIYCHSDTLFSPKKKPPFAYTTSYPYNKTTSKFHSSTDLLLPRIFFIVSNT